MIFDRNRDLIYEAVIEKEEIRELFENYKDSTVFDVFHTDSRDTLYRTRCGGRGDEKEVRVTYVVDSVAEALGVLKQENENRGLD